MVFVSTSCLKGEKSFFEPSILRVLDIYQKMGIKDIELGAAHQPVCDLEDVFRKCREFGENFVCHGNFPPTGEKRMLNLCSQDPEMQELSFSSAKNSVDFISRLGGKISSMHFGYLSDVSIKDEPVSGEVSYEKALETGANFLGRVCDYAADAGVDIAVENSPPHPFSLTATPEHLKNILNAVSAKNLGILMDLGHAARAEMDMGIERKDFVKLKEKILQFHMHQVIDGKDHNPVTDAEAVFSGFDKDFLKQKVLVLEALGQTEEQILGSLAVISKALQ